MHSASLTSFSDANRPTARSFTPKCTNVQLVKFTAEIIAKAAAVIGEGKRKILARQAKVSIRTIDNWRSGDRTVDMEQFFHLLEGDYGVSFFQVFWDRMPEVTRERWIQHEILRRKLEAREAARRLEDDELSQLQMTLSRQKI